MRGNLASAPTRLSQPALTGRMCRAIPKPYSAGARAEDFLAAAAAQDRGGFCRHSASLVRCCGVLRNCRCARRSGHLVSRSIPDGRGSAQERWNTRACRARAVAAGARIRRRVSSKSFYRLLRYSAIVESKGSESSPAMLSRIARAVAASCACLASAAANFSRAAASRSSVADPFEVEKNKRGRIAECVVLQDKKIIFYAEHREGRACTASRPESVSAKCSRLRGRRKRTHRPCRI